jgi:WD40 repeat protein
VAVSPDGRRALSSGASDRVVRLWDLSDGNLLHGYEGHVALILGVAFAPDGRRALSCDADYCVRLWRLPEPDADPATAK